MRIDPDAIQSSRPVDRDIQLLADEVRRLRAIIANSEPTLTDAEREAVAVAMHRCDGPEFRTLRGLLERTSPSST